MALNQVAEKQPKDLGSKPFILLRSSKNESLMISLLTNEQQLWTFELNVQSLDLNSVSN